MKKRVGKKAQSTISMPFGLIFSIILIVIFIVIAIIAVKYFLNIGKCSQVGLFYSDLGGKINNAWKSTQVEEEFKISLPSAVEKVCLANMSARITNQQDAKEIMSYNPDSNVFLIPASGACDMSSKTIAHLNIQEITKNKNPYCVPVSSNLRIVKGIYDKLVVIQ